MSITFTYLHMILVVLPGFAIVNSYLVRNCHTQCKLSFISVIYLPLFSPSRQLQGKPDPMALGMMLHLMLMQCEEPPLPGSGWGSPGCRRLQTSLCSRYNGAQARAQSSPWRELRELVAYLSMTQAAKFCGWIGPSESRKTFKQSLIYLLKMFCNSAKRRLHLTPNISNLTHPHLLQSLPVLCVWHTYSTDSTYTQQKCSLAPVGIQPSEIESPDHFSSVWRALVGTREMLW